MNLIIDSCFSEPPSNISCFRDVTLYAKCFVVEDVLVQCPVGTRSIYWEWLKAYGAHDFVSELIREDESEFGFRIKSQGGDFNIDRLDHFNLASVISALNKFRNN